MNDDQLLHDTFAYLSEKLEADGVDWRARIERPVESLYAQCDEMATLAGISLDDAIAEATERRIDAELGGGS